MTPPQITHVKIKHGRCSICGHHGADCTGSEYPEHDRLKSISEYSQQIGAFLEWLQEDGVVLARISKRNGDRLLFDHQSIPERLARYFDIDQNKLETEKREMLAAIRVESAKQKIRQELAI